MINWNFDTKDYNPNGHFTLLAPGDYRVRIDEAEETKSKAGKDMIRLVLSVSGKSNKLWFYLVFPNDPHDEKYQKSKAMTNQKLGEVWESFNLKVGDMNVLNWRGHNGAACAELGRKFIGCEINETYFNTARARIEAAEKQERLMEEDETE